jgi:hypothetical protein
VSKRYDEAIEVTPTESSKDGDTGVPLSFIWRGRRYEIDQQLSSWREGGGWKERDFHRVLARPSGAFATGELDADGFMLPPQNSMPGAVYDLAFDRIKKIWKLARLWD